MRALIETIRTTTPEGFDFEWLGDLVRSIDPAELDLTGCIPSIEGMTDNYARNILLLDPFEVVVLHWPPGVESAIHHHEGFWGYVLCIEGVRPAAARGAQMQDLLQNFPHATATLPQVQWECSVGF